MKTGRGEEATMRYVRTMGRVLHLPVGEDVRPSRRNGPRRRRATFVPVDDRAITRGLQNAA